MVGILWLLVWTAAAVLALAAVMRFRMRLRAHVHRRPKLEDDDVRDIIAFGHFVSAEDEPLDLNKVHEEERRFWEESEWEEAEE